MSAQPTHVDNFLRHLTNLNCYSSVLSSLPQPILWHFPKRHINDLDLEITLLNLCHFSATVPEKKTVRVGQRRSGGETKTSVEGSKTTTTTEAATTTVLVETTSSSTRVRRPKRKAQQQPDRESRLGITIKVEFVSKRQEAKKE